MSFTSRKSDAYADDVLPRIHLFQYNELGNGAEGGLTDPAVLLSFSGLFLIFLSIVTISRVALFTQLAPFALFCDLDVTPSFEQ
jgi:hypothetical protein